MCRNIRVLHHFEPPTTEEEIRAAALQYVRKVSGTTAPARATGATGQAGDAFGRAVDEIAAATSRLLATLPARGEPRTREGERERARERWKIRETRMLGRQGPRS
jgi:hypothetical protein